MEHEDDQQQKVVALVSADKLAIVFHPRKIHMYSIAEPELESLGNGSLRFSLDVGFLGISIGALAASGIALLTINFESPLKLAVFTTMFILSLVGSGYFGVRIFLSWREMKRCLAQIKSRTELND